MQSLKNQHVMILGLGISGLAMARWCARFGASVSVVDTRKNPPKLSQINIELPDVQFIFSEFTPKLIDNDEIHYLLVSPGIKPTDTNELLFIAKEKNVHIGNELTLFNLALEDLKEVQHYSPYVLAITGTNGKTTVTSLTGKLVACANKSVAIAGNIGPSLLDTLGEKIVANALPEVWVLELSSFQLNAAAGFEPTAGVVLNLTEDHLDWHGTMAAYIEAKSYVFGSQGYMVINRDDKQVMQLLGNTQPNNKHKKYCTFGGDVPTRLGDYGLETVNGVTWLVRASSSEEILVKKPRTLLESSMDLQMQRLMPVEAMQIRGEHNMLNALAALALVELIGCNISKVLYGLREYKGEPHRVESIGLFKGIEYFDDSKGTNVGATVAAISSLGVDRKIVAILGGDGKGQDFSPLREALRRYARAVVLIGRDKDIIAEILEDVNLPKISADTMANAIRAASEVAHVGDVVLLSPACASLDMFDNYVHRGKVFKAEVSELYSQADGALAGDVPDGEAAK
jgi:UDP-N-acetylmuramoylalanine--D-glutamate ligase